MKRTVGQPKLKFAFVYSVLILTFSWFLFDSSPWQGMKVFAVVLDIILVGIVIPGIAYCQIMWKVDEQKLCYIYHHSFINKVIGFYQFICHQKHIYQVQLNLDQIDYIDVTYNPVPRAPFGGNGYDLLFEVHMFDGSIYVFEALVTRDRKSFCQAVTMLRDMGIEFKDPYKILDYLQTGSYLSYYLEKLEADKHD